MADEFRYALEYGLDEMEMHEDAVSRGERIILVDDLIATGGTAEAAVRLLRQLGAEILGACFVIDLQELGGTKKGQNIAVRHLASHTSGYRGLNLASTESAYFYSWEKFVEFFRNTTQTFSPGTVFNYEHTESVVLG